MKFIKQQDESDCGAACISMILTHYGSKVPLYKIRELSGTDTSGTSMLGLKKVLENYNINSKVIKADNNIWHNEEIYPIIAHIIVDNKFFHYVVIEDIKNDKLKILDPEKGKESISINDFNKEWTGVILIPYTSADYKPINEIKSDYRYFLSMLQEQKKNIFWIIILSTITTILGILGSFYVQFIIDYIIPSHTSSTLLIITSVLLFSYVLSSIFSLIHNYLLFTFGQKMSKDIMLRYMKHVYELPMNFFATRKSGEIISRFLDANKVIDALSSATISFFLDISTLLIIGVALFIQNKTLFFITILSFPFYIAVILYFVKRFEKGNREEMASGSSLNSSIIESFDGIETIKSFNGEQAIFSKIEKNLKDYISKSLFNLNTDNIQQNIKQLINMFSSTIILCFGTLFVLNNQLSLGQLMTYNALLLYFTNSLQNTINLQVKIQTAKVANTRLNEIMFIEAEKQNKAYISESLFLEDIHIKNLNYAYNMKSETLKNISLKITAKSKVAITGVSGSGKSTLGKLLVNLYEPTEGNIFFGTAESTKINHNQLRNQVIYVPQEPFFFYGTIIENITFGIDNVPPLEQIESICSSIGILDFINNSPLRFDSIIEEGGANLSGGQKQRFSLVRALLKNSSIIILDEITNGFDNLLEDRVINYLLTLEEKTIIFITHHLSVSRKCDTIFVLDSGEIKQSGTHDILKNKPGVYHDLYNIQKL